MRGGLFRVLETLAPDNRREVADAFAHSLSTSFLVAVPCLAFAFVLVSFLEEKELRGRDTVAARTEGSPSWPDTFLCADSPRSGPSLQCARAVAGLC